MKKTFYSLKLFFIPCLENNFRPKFLAGKTLIWVILVLFFLKALTIPFLIYFPKHFLFGEITKSFLIDLLNKERKARGLEPLKENKKLEKAAFLKAQDILEKDYFSHKSPEGIEPWYWFEIVGYNYKLAGENLAIGFLDSEEVHSAWLDSPSHKANLLNPNYKEVGIAVMKGNFKENETTVVVQLFGAPKESDRGLKVTTKSQTEEYLSNEKISSNNFANQNQAEKISPKIKEIKEYATLKSLNFLNYKYHKILQIIIYGLLGLIILSLILNIFINIKVQHFDLILKTIIFIAILTSFVLFDKLTIINFIPHEFYIY